MIEQELHNGVAKALSELFQSQSQPLQFQKTRKEFEGDITLVVFPLTRFSKKSPEQTGQAIGQYLKDNIQNPNHIVPTWTWGGEPTRDALKQKEFLQNQGFRFTNGIAHQACGFQN